MILKRRLYIAVFVLLVFIASAFIAFIAQKDSSQDYKGTLVYGCTLGGEELI